MITCVHFSPSWLGALSELCLSHRFAPQPNHNDNHDIHHYCYHYDNDYHDYYNDNDYHDRVRKELGALSELCPFRRFAPLPGHDMIMMIIIIFNKQHALGCSSNLFDYYDFVDMISKMIVIFIIFTENNCLVRFPTSLIQLVNCLSSRFLLTRVRRNLKIITWVSTMIIII